MYFTYKKHLFRLFAIFFLALSPFLAVYSLGYSFDLEEGKFNNTIDIEINTVPRGAGVWNNHTPVMTTPGSLKARDGQLISLQITRDDYFSEKFDIWSQPNQNTTARLEDIYLLPKQKEVKVNEPSKQLVAILSEELILFKESNQLYVQLTSFNGLRGSPELVQTRNVLLNQLQPGQWESLLDNFFLEPSNNLLLYKNNSRWVLVSLDQTSLSAVSVAKVSENSIVILDLDKKLWLIELGNNLEIVFLANQVDGLGFTKSPDSLWLWRGNTIYSVPKSNIALIAGQLENYEYFSSRQLEGLNDNLSYAKNQDPKFAVKNVHQGLAFKINRSLFYVADFALGQPTLISDGVISFSSASNTLFWLDENFGLYSLNLGINQQEYFGDLDLKEDSWRSLRLFYYAKWERIFVYSRNQTISVWFDKNILNQSVATYYPIAWIDQSLCHPEVYEDFQFCLQNNQLVSYKNTEIW